MVQYRGALPFGLSWNNTASTTAELLGPPDKIQDRPEDDGYEMGYQMKNVCFATLFFNEGEKKLKIWRVYENYPDKYPPALPAAQPSAPKTHPQMAAAPSGRNG